MRHKDLFQLRLRESHTQPVLLVIEDLLMDQGQRDEVRDVLADVYGWFTEGFETEGLRDAKAWLESLG